MSKITIIAEMGINHQGKMSVAKELISQAKRCGADLVKSQLYDVDKLFPDKKIITQGRNWYEEVKKTQLSKEQTFQLAEWCKEAEIEFFASAFDLERLSWLEEIRVRRHKIASIFNKNMEYIDAVIDTGKEILFSCQRIQFLTVRLDPLVKYLYCIPKYPTSLNDLKLNEINFGIREKRYPFRFQGFSSHYPGIEPAIAAMARGARIIEKHFTLSRRMTGPDMICSIEPNELRELVRYARKFEEIL